MTRTFKAKQVPKGKPLFHPNYDLESYPDVKPIWGEEVKRMLEKGGHLKEWESANLYLTRGDTGTPRSPAKPKEFYPGCFTVAEPQPSVFDLISTQQLVRFMWRSKWTWEQIADFFLYTDVPGTLYYRWRMSTDRESYNLHDWLMQEIPARETDTYFLKKITEENHREDDKEVMANTSLSSSPSNTPTEPKDYSTRESELDALVRFLRVNPGLSSTELRKQKIWGVHPYRLGQVMKDAEKNGLIESAKFRAEGSKARSKTIWSAVESIEASEFTSVLPDEEIAKLMEISHV